MLNSAQLPVQQQQVYIGLCSKPDSTLVPSTEMVCCVQVKEYEGTIAGMRKQLTDKTQAAAELKAKYASELESACLALPTNVVL